MPDFRRAFVPGGTFFFTLVTHRRRRFLNDVPARPVPGSLFRRCKMRWPFTMNAIVLLPQHLHAIWTMPAGDSNYSQRWGWMKKEFTKTRLDLGGKEEPISRGRQREGRRGIWQPRFWEHTIEMKTILNATLITSIAKPDLREMIFIITSRNAP